jgi:hypothetical protein
MKGACPASRLECQQSGCELARPTGAGRPVANLQHSRFQAAKLTVVGLNLPLSRRARKSGLCATRMTAVAVTYA